MLTVKDMTEPLELDSKKMAAIVGGMTVGQFVSTAIGILTGDCVVTKKSIVCMGEPTITPVK